MSTAELKNQIHELVVETDSPEILEQVAAFFQSLLSQKDWGETISDNEKNLIKIGLEQLKNGQSVPYEKVRLKAKKMLQTV